jgi:hypothetical protein
MGLVGVSFLIRLAALYLKPETLKAKYQTAQQPNTKQPNSQRRLHRNWLRFLIVFFITAKFKQ